MSQPNQEQIEKELDELLESDVDIRTKIDALNEFCIHDIDAHSSKRFSERAYQCRELIKDYDYPLGLAYNKVAVSFALWGEYKLDEMRPESEGAIEMFKELGDKHGLIYALVTDIYGKLARGDFENAFQFSIEAIKIGSDIEDNLAKGWVHFTMAVMYFDIKDHENALKYYLEAVKIFKSLDHGFGAARSGAGAGTCYIKLGKFDEAKELIPEVIKYFEENPNDEGLARVVNDYGVLLFHLKEYEEAEKYLMRAREIRKGLKNLRGYGTTLLDLAELLLEINRPEEAKDHLKEALELSIKYKAQPKEVRSYKLIYKAYKALKQTEGAFDALEKYVTLNEQVSGAETAHRLKLQESNFRSEQANKIAEVERQKNIELKEAHDEIAQKNQEITDSINYAERIQRSFMATQDLLDENLGQYFVYFNPKEAVSGDFYWAGTLSNDHFAISCADSTGHGVPGAIMSILNISAIEEAVKEGKNQPAEIFNRARTTIIERLKKDGSTEGGKDGMDASLLILDKEKTTLQYVAANNPIWIIRNGELIDIKPEKMPVGKHDHDQIPFEGGEFKLQSGDIIYTMTDGYQDQFGGPKGKKFKVKPMKRMLLEIVDKSMKEQEQFISQTFDNWKGELEQVDDVCLIGIKI